ncbi:DUF948 domain-containing protein [Paenibacillus sp. LjRoot153]|uniref:DUF948 domain-containing protein n=1 Tax=Paenibacillus sp. LjRoot153 TaxID=3342270 RepID=UPI003ED0AE44
MMLQISVSLVAVAFAFLVFYLIQTLKSLKHSLDEITSTMGQMKNEVTEISSDVKDVILNTNEVAIDMRMKLSNLNHLFSSVQDVGQVIHELSSSVKQSASSILASVQPKGASSKQASPFSGKLRTILQGATMTLEIWDKMKSKKSSPQAGTMK